MFIPYRLELNMYKLNISGATLDKCPQKGIDVFLSAPSCCEGSLSFARRLTTSGMRGEWEESNKTPVDLHVSLYTTRELLPVCGQPDPPHLPAGLQTSPDVERALPPLSFSFVGRIRIYLRSGPFAAGVIHSFAIE